MKKIVFTLSIAAATLFAGQSSMEVAKESMQKLGGALKSELKQKFKEDPSGIKAINYCSDQAQEITKKINSQLDTGVTVRRTALRYRNNANEPTIQDIEVMRNFKKAMDNGKKADNLAKVVQSDDTTYVYKALGVGKSCTKCHGDVNKMDKDILSQIDKNFPYDKARNFAQGDFRGAIVVEIKK
ncbi:MAG: Tll0287-like domain-containing protein [Campylobacterota bacterium]